LGGRLVLTAAHVVTGNAAAGITVRGPDKVPHPARIVDRLAGDPSTVDLALLELCDEIAVLPPPPVAVVDRDAPVPVPVEGCWAVGYPLFQEVESAAGVVRETAQVWGMILPAENLVGRLLSLQVTSAPRALPPEQEALGQSQWSGMSGAAVLAGERLIGVVSEHAPRRGESTITVTPLANLDRLPATAAARWWAYLAADPKRLVMLPARRERAEPAYQATLRQLRARTGVLQRRDEELEAIGAFAAGRPSALAPPGSRYAWLVGGPWAGKTALLAEAVHALPPEVDCVAYFLTRPTGDADRERFVAAVVPQLAWLVGVDPPSALDVHVFRQLWEQAAQRAADAGRQLLLIVDGLDEDLRPGGHSVAAWLPGLPGRVLVSSRLYPRLPDDVDPAHPLAALARDNKLYTLPDSPHAVRLRELADQEISQLLRRAGDDLALDMLGLLTAARGGPLAAADLATLTGSRPWKVRGVLDGEAARILQQVGPTDAPRYTFAHETLLARCQQQGVGDPSHARRIEEWAATWRDRGWPSARDGQEGTPLYLLDRYPQTLYSDPPRLRTLLTDVAWIQARLAAGQLPGLLADYGYASDPLSQQIPRALRLSAQLLAANPGQVRGQLAGRLLAHPDPAVADWATGLTTNGGPGPWLAPLTPALTATTTGLQQVLTGHDGWVWSVAVTADGTTAVSGGQDGTVRVWDLAAGTQRAQLTSHDGLVLSVAVTADGTTAVSSGGDGTVRVSDLATGTQRAQLTGHDGWVLSVAVTADGATVVSGGYDGTVRAWDLATGTQRAQLTGHQGEVNSVAVTADGATAVSGGEDGTVRVWDLATGTQRAELAGHGRPVNSVAITPDGTTAVSGGQDGDVRMWDLATGDHWPEIGGHGGTVGSVAVTPGGTTAVSCGGFPPADIRVWDLATGELRAILDGPGSEASRVAVTADGTTAVSGGEDGAVRVWDLAAGRKPRLLTVGEQIVTRHERKVASVAVTADGATAFSSYDDDDAVRVWDLATGTQRAELGDHFHIYRPVRSVAVTPDGAVAVIGGDDGAVRAWGAYLWGAYREWNQVYGHEQAKLAGHEQDKLTGHHGAVLSVAVTADGATAVSGGDDGTVRAWDLAAGTQRAELSGHQGAVRSVAVTADGATAVSGGDDGTVRAWDLATQRELASWMGDSAVVDCTVLPGQRLKIAVGQQYGQPYLLELRGQHNTVIVGKPRARA
jgi:WD40 repeat protein